MDLAGMNSLTFVILIIFGSIALTILTMAFVYWSLMPKRIKIDDPISGVLEVTAASHPHEDNFDFTVTGVLHVEGMAARAIDYEGTAEVGKHPQAGMRLPVTVSRSKPSLLRVEWDQVLSLKEQGQLEAKRRADEINNPSKPQW